MVYSLQVCLIWLEFPPPPTWHSPHSLEHCRPGVLTSTPSAGLGDHSQPTTVGLGEEDTGRGRKVAKSLPNIYLVITGR